MTFDKMLPKGEAGTPDPEKTAGGPASRAGLLRAFVLGQTMPEHGPLTTQMSALYVDEWWPAAVRLNSKVFFIRLDDDPPMPGIAEEMAAMLTERGLSELGSEQTWPLLDGVTLQRLGVVGPRWQVWGESPETVTEAINGAVMEIDSVPDL